MTERISNKAIGYLEKYPEFLTGVHSDTEAGRLSAGYYNLRQEQKANPWLTQSLTWRSLELTARKRIQETFDDISPPGSSYLQLDSERRQVTIDGRPKLLSPTLFLILSILGEHPGQVITAQDLARTLERHLKPEQYYEATKMPTYHITSLIQRLRKALGDNPKSPRFIETVPRVGYSLIANTD